LKEHYDAPLSYYPIPKEQNKRNFLKHAPGSFPNTDRYVTHRQLFAFTMLCDQQYLFSVSCTQILNIKFMSSPVVNFFRSLVHNTMSTREERGIVRPDMIQLLMQAKKGTLQGDDNATANGNNIKPSTCKTKFLSKDSGVLEYDAVSCMPAPLKQQVPPSQHSVTLQKTPRILSNTAVRTSILQPLSTFLQLSQLPRSHIP
jgi:hypothetical protein